MYDDTIKIHLGQLGITSPLIPKLFPHGFMIEVSVDPQGVPTLTNLGEFSLIIYDTISEGGLETTVLLQGEHDELKMDNFSHFTVTVFSPAGNPLSMVVYLKVWEIQKNDGCNYELVINPKLVC